MKDQFNTSNLVAIKPRMRELEREIDEIEWEGLAPEKMVEYLTELRLLRELDSLGDVWMPKF